MRTCLFSLALLLAGCSTGRYDADYAKALSAYRDAAPFAVLQPQPTQFFSGRVSIRLPLGFTEVVDAPPLAEGGPPLKPDPSRLRPPFLAELPGYQAAHEQRLTAEGAGLPVAVSVGVLPASAGRVALEKTIIEQAQADESFTGDRPAWIDRQVEPRDGGPPAWRVLTLVGQQVFESVVAGNQEYKRLDGTCEIWLSADSKQDVITILAWRVPEKVSASLPLPLAQLAEVVARTVAIGPAAAAPADSEPPPETAPGAPPPATP